MKTEKTMKNISAWPWKGIWHSLGVLAILLSMAYSPYLLLSGRLDRIEDTIDRRFEAMERTMNSRFEAVDRRFEAMDRRFESMETTMDMRFDAVNDKLASIDKRLAVVEDRVGVTAQHVPVRPDFALAPRAVAEPAAVSVLDAEPTPRPARTSRRFALSGARLLCDILPVVPGGAFLGAAYARSCQACAIGASA